METLEEGYGDPFSLFGPRDLYRREEDDIEELEERVKRLEEKLEEDR